MTIKLFDLCGTDEDLRFSPFVWRTKLALKHKGLDFETIPWRFQEKDAIAASGQTRVPVIIDGPEDEPASWVSDSWKIAEYLDEAYPDRPALFGSPAGMAHLRFLSFWVDRSLFPVLTPPIILPLMELLSADDEAYFRKTREPRFGSTLEAFAQRDGGTLHKLNAVLEPLRQTVRKQPFLGGDAPDYGDYMVFGVFQWARCASPEDLLQADDPVYQWRGRVLDLFDGYAAQAPCRVAA
ncbi:MAG: glutathione S-transferase family protein [Pseudomonadota bacterium]